MGGWGRKCTEGLRLSLADCSKRSGRARQRLGEGGQAADFFGFCPLGGTSLEPTSPSRPGSTRALTKVKA